MSPTSHTWEEEGAIHNFAASAPKARTRVRVGAAIRKAPEPAIETNREDASSPSSLPVPDPYRLDELRLAISAAANVSIRTDRPINPPEYRATVQVGWFLVRTYLSIRDPERRRAVLNFVAEQAQLDKAQDRGQLNTDPLAVT